MKSHINLLKKIIKKKILLFEPQVPEKACGFCFAKDAPDEKLCFS